MTDSPLILTIDDEKYVRKSIRFFLEDCDFSVLEADNGKSGLALFREHRPDLVLLDLRMPEMDGLEVLENIRKEGGETPVIVVSGNGAIRDVVAALRLGAWDYLIKPIEDLSMLQHAIDKSLERARLIKENRRHHEQLEKLVENRTRELIQTNQTLSHLNERLHRAVETTRHISSLSRLDHFGERLLEAFGSHMNARGGSLYLLADSGFELVHCLDPGHATPFLPLPPADGSILHMAWSNGKPLLIDSLEEHRCPTASCWPGYTSGSALIFPLTGEESRVVGLISLHSPEEKPYDEQDMEIGSILASYSSEALAAANGVAALRESEERKELALQGANLGMWDWNVPSGAMLMDRRTEEMLGYDYGAMEPTVESWEAHVHPDDLEDARRTLDVHLSGRTPCFQCEYRVLNRAGEVRWILDRGKVVARDYQGNPIRVTGTHLDITDRKGAELALRENEEKFRAIIEHNPVPMLITQGEHEIEYLNLAFTEQFGYSGCDVENMSEWWSEALADEHREQARATWNTAIGRGEYDHGALDEWQLHCLDGTERCVEVKLMALGEMTITTLTDITERKLVERQVREMNRNLEERVQSSTAQLEATREELLDASQKAGLAEVATGTIHNIGNILTSFNVSTDEVSSRLANSKIKGFLMANQMLEEHADNLSEFLTQDPKGKQIPRYFLALGQKIHHEHELIKQEIASLNAKIEMMRDVISTQQTHARAVGSRERVDLVDLTEHALKLQHHNLKSVGVTVQRDFQGNPAGKYLRAKLTHVLINLIKNSTEAMADNEALGRKAVLRVDVYSQESHNVIRVRDNGCGIDADNLARVFSFGFTTKQTGHGFGLNTCMRWMQEMGGTLTVASEGEGKGATFTILLPLFMED